MTGQTAPARALALATRRPTGRPSWPMALIAGAEKAGKSWACAQASSSDLIGRTFWIGIGEDDPDEYGQIPGANFEIVLHDGTYRGIYNAIDAAVSQPPTDGKPNLIVMDSMTWVWDLLCDMAQDTANARRNRKASKENRAPGEEDALISMDLWNQAKDRWQAIVSELRAHQGPVLLTARLEEVTVMDGAGNPTKAKQMKVKAEKSLPYDVGAVVHMPERGKSYLMGVRSARIQLPEPRIYPGFTVDKLWRDLGLHESVTSERVHATVQRTEQDAPQPVQAAPAPQATAAPVQAAPAPDPALAEAVNRVLASKSVDDLRATFMQTPEQTRALTVQIGAAPAAVLGLPTTPALGALIKAAGEWVKANNGDLSVAEAAALDPANDATATSTAA